MEKIKKLIPKKISVLGHNIVLPVKTFDAVIETLNLQTEAINNLIDAIALTDAHLDSLDILSKNLQNSVQTLAEALETYTEE